MDLNTILKKTQEKSDRVKRNREPVYIATTERPYEFPTPEKMPNDQIKTVNKVVTNREQTDYEVATNWQQTNNETDYRDQPEKIKWQQSGNKVATKPTTEVVTNREQTDNKVTTNSSFSALVGVQRSITLFIYQECKKSRSKITDPLTLEHIASQVKANKKTIKTSVYRLEVKGYLVRREFKNGRGGWTRYELPELVFRELLESESDNKLVTNWQQTDYKLASELTTQPTTSPPSSSSINIYKTTTTGLPEEWLAIDISEASSFGFTQNHLLQLFKTGSADPTLIGESIQHFLFDLENNGKTKEIKTNPLGYFMGILKRAGVYAPPENYESPKDRAMRIYVENQKIIHDRKMKMEKELFDIEFQKWVGLLSEEEKNNIIPDHVKQINLMGPKIAVLRTHYENMIWPTQKEELHQAVLEEEPSW